MLDWKNLTNSQRATAVMFLVFLMAVLLLEVWGVAHPSQGGARDVLAAVAVSSFMLGILLNPDAVHGRGTAVNPRAAPKVCQALVCLAILALLLRGLCGVAGLP